MNPIFSFYLTKNANPGSKITFGGYDVSKYAKNGLAEKDIMWIDIDQENMNYWSLPMNGDQIRFGKDDKKNVANITSSNVILDSGLSYALIPSKDIQALNNLLNTKYGISCTRD